MSTQPTADEVYDVGKEILLSSINEEKPFVYREVFMAVKAQYPDADAAHIHSKLQEILDDLLQIINARKLIQ